MNVNEWFLNKGSHAQGIEILIDLNVSISLVLSLEEPTLSNKAALKYELGKYKTDPTVNDRLLYANMPYELREKAREKNNLFYQACELKLKLNSISEEKIDQALEIQEKIYKLFTRIDQIWSEIDYYKKHKVLIEPPQDIDLDALTIPELYKLRENLHCRKSRRKKTIEKKKEQLIKEIQPQKQFKIKQSIASKEAQLEGINQILIQLNELLNE